ARMDLNVRVLLWRRAAFIVACVAIGVQAPLPNGSPARADEPAAPLTVRILPERVTLHGARAAQRFIVLGTFADGLERDVTGQCRFALSDPGLLALDAAGRITPSADGECDVKAEVGKKTATAHVRVERSAEAPPFSFARDIGRIFTQRGCNASSCHGSV